MGLDIRGDVRSPPGSLDNGVSTWDLAPTSPGLPCCVTLPGRDPLPG